MTNKIKKILIIILTVILLVFIVFLIMQLVNSFKSAEGIIEQENQEAITESIFIESISDLANIAIQEKNQNGNFLNLYENQDFINKIEDIKSSSDSVLIHTNLSSDGLKYCAVVMYDNENYLCIDDTSGEIYYTDNCLEEVSCTNQLPLEDMGEIIEEEIAEKEVIEEDVTEEEIIEEEVVEEEEGLLVIETTPITIGDTTLIEKYIEEEKFVIINGEEMGPYSEMFLEYDDSSYGILCNYNGSWYLNMNGKVSKPSELNEGNINVHNFYVLDGGYVYIYDISGQYFVSDNGDTLGPFEEYPNLFE